MNTALDEIANEYRWAVREFLAGAGESALRQAYEIGRKGLARGVGVLEMAQVHQQCVADILGPERPEIAASQSRLRALDFFAESLSAFEMALRGYRETNAQLQRNLSAVLEIQRQLREENEGLAEANEAVAAERQGYQQLCEFIADAYLVTELNGKILEANSAAGRLFGAQLGSLAGRNLLPYVAEAAEFRAELQRFQGRLLERRENWLLTLKPENREPVLIAASVAADPRGGRLRWLLQDISERKRALDARQQALAGKAETQAAGRFEILAEASRLLASSQDYETTLASVAQLAVPYLADFCLVHVLELDGSVWQVAAAGAEQATAASTAGTQPAMRPHRKTNPEFFARIKRPEAIETVTEDWLEQYCGDREQTEALGEFAFQSALIAPMLAGDRIMGTLTFFIAPPRRHAGGDAALAEDLARRCALALDNGRLYREVLQERDRAEKASRAKDEFLAILSHELRNPLTPLTGWARILKDHEKIKEDPFLAEAVSALERGGRHIAKLVGDCLDLTRVSRGAITIERRATDLNQVVQASVQLVSEGASEKGVGLEPELSPQALWVSADATRMQQVVMNLLLNAIAYTCSGGWVRVRTRQSGDEAELTVQDNGAGIEPRDLEEIFLPFRVSTKAWLKSKSGVGLGLAIARRLVEMHGGRIRAESEGPGRGSIFRIRLPLTAAEPAGEIDAGPPPAAAGRSEPLRVLVVEDCSDILFLMRMELENLGYEVVTAGDGEEALELAVRERPDVILSDIKMPGIDGYELIRRIRAVPELAGLPAIALTGFGMPAEVERALLAGYDHSLTKPAEADEIDVVIRKIAKRKESPAI